MVFFVTVRVAPIGHQAVVLLGVLHMLLVPLASLLGDDGLVENTAVVVLYGISVDNAGAVNVARSSKEEEERCTVGHCLDIRFFVRIQCDEVCFLPKHE